ncbi:MAG: M67 family metallopeptidase [Treponema sp.]|jgi:proteasome lid subunit RPN8/RPN11|nr:M67 family metallopeptidase [Treponema sp.]
MIVLGNGVYTRIRAEGEAAYPHECCGFLLGIGEAAGRRAEMVLPVENHREEAERYHRFIIEPEDFLYAERLSARRGMDIIGIYHSHPDCPAVPSDYDHEHALPFYSYVIVAVEKGKAGSIRSWELSAVDRAFNEEKLCQ